VLLHREESVGANFEGLGDTSLHLLEVSEGRETETDLGVGAFFDSLFQLSTQLQL